MPATFSRIKDWVAEVLTYEDLNAEIDNILENLEPQGIDDYSVDIAQMRETASPVDGSGNPSLANSLAEEIKRLRYQIQSIMGSGADNWYDAPDATLSGLSIIVFGNTVPASRIESIGFDDYQNRLIPNGSNASLTLEATEDNPIVYYINSVKYTLDEDVVLSGLSAAPAADKTATVNEAVVGGTHAASYASEHGTLLHFSSPGTNFSAADGILQAYKVVNGGSTEYFMALQTDTVADGTVLRQGRRGWFFNSANTAWSRVQFADGNTLTVCKLVYVFLRDNQTLTLTYTPPQYSLTEPDAPSLGDYWFDFDTFTWKVYGAMGWVESSAVLIGYAVMDGTNCVAARMVEPFKAYESRNEAEISVNVDYPDMLSLNELQASLSVYGGTFYFGVEAQDWDDTVLETGSSLSASTTYYAYVKEDGSALLSTIAPHDRRGDLAGYYHPSHSWRCIGYATTDGSSVFDATTLMSLSRISDRSLLASTWLESNYLKANTVTTEKLADLAVTTPKLAAGSVTQEKRAALNYQVSSSCGTFSTTSTTRVDVTNLTVDITTTGRPVMLMLINESTTNNFGLIGTSQSATVTPDATFSFVRSGTVIANYVFTATVVGSTQNSTTVPVTVLQHFDVPAAGTYTYKIQAMAGSTSENATVANAKLVAYEL